MVRGEDGVGSDYGVFSDAFQLFLRVAQFVHHANQSPCADEWVLGVVGRWFHERIEDFLAVLGVLWGVLMIFKLVFARPKKEKKAEAPKVEPATVDIVESEPAPAATDDAELIAILTAAIYAYEAEQSPDAQVGNFKVVSYRRTNGGRSWNAK